VAWLTGSQKKERRAMLALVASGEAALVVGTHAVIQDKVTFRNLALAIIDEQHRFGVAQRLALRDKMREPGHGAASADDERHPIPRTLGHELLRRPGRVHHRRTAARAHAHRHQGGQRERGATR
jgi:ATP-dependent DNA helicase RecG